MNVRWKYYSESLGNYCSHINICVIFFSSIGNINKSIHSENISEVIISGAMPNTSPVRRPGWHLLLRLEHLTDVFRGRFQVKMTAWFTLKLLAKQYFSLRGAKYVFHIYCKNRPFLDFDQSKLNVRGKYYSETLGKINNWQSKCII